HRAGENVVADFLRLLEHEHALVALPARRESPPELDRARESRGTRTHDQDVDRQLLALEAFRLPGNLGGFAHGLRPRTIPSLTAGRRSTTRRPGRTRASRSAAPLSARRSGTDTRRTR